jgi:hypothetical protein
MIQSLMYIVKHSSVSTEVKKVLCDIATRRVVDPELPHLFPIRSYFFEHSFDTERKKCIFLVKVPIYLLIYVFNNLYAFPGGI